MSGTPSKLGWEDGKKYGSTRGWTPRHDPLDDKERSLESIWRSARDKKPFNRGRKNKKYEDGEAVDDERDIPEFKNDKERWEWEDNNYELERQWYENDQGYNDEFNPFANVSEEYIYKREKQLERAREKPKLSVRQQEIKKENELWENNRLKRSGIFVNKDVGTVIDAEIDENRVNLLVHNTIPPFLDGRFVYTKQIQPVIPVSSELYYFYMDLPYTDIIFRSKMSPRIWQLPRRREAKRFDDSVNRRNASTPRKSIGNSQVRISVNLSELKKRRMTSMKKKSLITSK